MARATDMRARHENRSRLWALGMNDDTFRRRCASALVHPATVTALAVLLLNDLVFKSIWPGSWATGKLSDLAWVVFASPLLAFLLSFLAGRSAFVQRAAFIASFVGLPLLYAAFNTFEPVHAPISSALAMLTGRLAGSTPNPTDSLVIPLGLATALWVWTRLAMTGSDDACRRLALLLAGVAAIGSVASIESNTDVGVGRVEIREDGAAVATTFHYAIGSRQPAGSFTSSDGGLTWAKTAQLYRGEEADLGASADEGVETPRGRYGIDGQGIMLIGPDGESELAYSTAYLREDGNVWVQEKWTTQLGNRSIATGARYIAYHERSGNLIAAMGIQGVVVGTPEGEWTRYAVGPYSPTDFSFSGKTGLLLSNGGFWATTLALSLSVTGLALVLSGFRRGDLLPMLATVALTGLVLFTGVPMLIGALGHSPRLELVFLVALVSSPLVTPAMTRAVVALGLMPMAGWRGDWDRGWLFPACWHLEHC